MSRKHITDEQYKIAFSNGLGKNTVNSRVRGLGWEIERAITEPINPTGQTTFTEEEMNLMKAHGVPEVLAYARIFNYKPKWDREKAMTTPIRGKRR